MKNPHFLFLISENFLEARAALSRCGVPNLPSNPSPVKMDVAPITSVAAPTLTSMPSGRLSQSILLNFFFSPVIGNVTESLNAINFFIVILDSFLSLFLGALMNYNFSLVRKAFNFLIVVYLSFECVILYF